MTFEYGCCIINRNYNFCHKEVKRMKAGLHPEYKEATIKCACGNTVATKTTKGDISVEICAKCHPFFTGKQKFVDAGGRVDKFKKRYGI